MITIMCACVYVSFEAVYMDIVMLCVCVCVFILLLYKVCWVRFTVLLINCWVRFINSLFSSCFL